MPTQRLQPRVAFERLLARQGGDPVWVLQGGFALELRYGWFHRLMEVDADAPLPPLKSTPKRN